MRHVFSGMIAWMCELRSRGSNRESVELTCRCGGTLHARRGRRRQILRCSQCGRKRLLFPIGAWPALPIPPEDAKRRSSGGAAIPRKRARRAAILGGLFLIVVIAVVLRQSFSARDQPLQLAAAGAGDSADRLEQGRRALAQGRFFAAAEDLEAEAVARPSRRTAQLVRQATLLADLFDWSLAEQARPPSARDQLVGLLQRTPAANDGRDSEWRARFERRYRGLAVIFDDVVHSEAGRLTLQPPLQSPARKGQVDLSDVALLRDLRMDWPKRLLFGARLATCRLEPPGATWVFRFEPESGVLLTDAAAVEGYLGKPPDADTLELLKRQAELLGELPSEANVRGR